MATWIACQSVHRPRGVFYLRRPRSEFTAAFPYDRRVMYRPCGTYWSVEWHDGTDWHATGSHYRTAVQARKDADRLAPITA